MSVPSGGSALDHLRHWHLRRATGTLALELGDRRRKLHLVEGQLHLPESNPLAGRLRGLPPPSPAPAVRAPWLELLARIADSLEEGSVRFAEFSPGRAALPRDLGPALPTAALLRAGYARRERSKRGGLGAEDGPVAAAPASAPTDALGWAPEELWVLEKLQAAGTLVALEGVCPFPAERLREVAAGLFALGALRRPSGAGDVARIEIDELARRFAQRVGASLVERPLEVDLEGFRRRISDLLARAGELGHDELLGVAPDAEPDAVQEAFEELARWVHPGNAARFAVPDSAPALAFLFERATEAYRTLADPQLRLAYLATRPAAAASSGPGSDGRLVEARQQARRLYDRAVYEESTGDLHTALQILEQTVRTDARAEYWSALGRLQARNPAWTTRAIESYRNALELDPYSGEVRFALGQLYERAGDLERARGQYQAAAAARPPHGGAREALARLAAARGEGGAFSRLFRRE